MSLIRETTVIRAPILRCFDLARDVEVHLKGNVHWGEQAVAAGGVTSGLLGMGERVTWRAKHLGVWWNLTSEITAFAPPTYFQDKMIKGPFLAMRHDHFFRALGPRETEMRDDFYVAAPVPFLGRYMRDLLRERNAVIKEVAEAECGS